MSKRLSRPVRGALVVALLFLVPGALILREGALYWATSTRVEGTVVGHESYGGSKGFRPIVQYEWDGKPYRCRSDWQATIWTEPEPIPLGTKIAVFVSHNGPSSSRLGIPFQWLFMPCWACMFPGGLFLLGAMVAMVWGKPESAEPVAAANPARESGSVSS